MNATVPRQSNASEDSSGNRRRESDDAARAAAADPTAPPPSATESLRNRPIPWLVRLRIEFVRSFLVFWARAFSLTGLFRLGQFFGTLEYLTDYNRRRRVIQKLTQYHKDQQSPAWRQRMAWRYFMRVRCDKMFYTIMDRLPRRKLLKRIRLIGREYIDGALAQNRGVYVALGHFGAHHVAGLVMALLGYRLVGVRDARESAYRRYMQKKYQDVFPEIASTEIVLANSFPRALYRHLKDNRILASLIDPERRRGENTRTRPVRIFGEDREFLTGPIRIALRCGAPILQGFVVSRPKFYFQLITTGTLLADDFEGDEDAAIASVLEHYARALEDFAHNHPDHLANI